MSTQLMFYETAVPLSAGRHGRCSVETDRGYGFARGVNSVPLTAVEFPLAAAEYPIVFARTGGQVLPVAVLGARRGENLCLGPDDRWLPRYVPAFVRRYPFVFAHSDDGKALTLCLDEAGPGVNFEGRGQGLFGPDGQPAAYVHGVLQFALDYRAQWQRTQAFGRRLHALGLLEPTQVEFEVDGAGPVRLGGFLVIGRERLKAVARVRLEEMLKSDELELAYLHLQSLRHFGTLRERLCGALGADVASTSRAPAGAPREV
jgi:hypothetical protein